MESIFLLTESFMTLPRVYKESLYKPKDFSEEGEDSGSDET